MVNVQIKTIGRNYTPGNPGNPWKLFDLMVGQVLWFPPARKRCGVTPAGGKAASYPCDFATAVDTVCCAWDVYKGTELLDRAELRLFKNV